MNASIVALPARSISGSMNDAWAPKAAASCTISCCMPWCADVARVLVGQHAGVDVEPRQLLVERVQLVERVGQRRRRRGELALELPQLRQVGGELLLRGAPRGVGRIDVGEVPLVLLRNLRAVAFLAPRAAVRAATAAMSSTHRPDEPRSSCAHPSILPAGPSGARAGSCNVCGDGRGVPGRRGAAAAVGLLRTCAGAGGRGAAAPGAHRAAPAPDFAPGRDPPAVPGGVRARRARVARRAGQRRPLGPCDRAGRGRAAVQRRQFRAVRAADHARADFQRRPARADPAARARRQLRRAGSAHDAQRADRRGAVCAMARDHADSRVPAA